MCCSSRLRAGRGGGALSREIRHGGDLRCAVSASLSSE